MTIQRAIFSLWTKPMVQQNWDVAEWQFFFQSWVLSVHQAKQWFQHVELYTDQFGHELLVERLQLPFDRVSLALNRLDHISTDWWMLGKLHTYECQEKPFLHIDNDVFLWQKLPERMLEADVCGQSLEPLQDSPGLFPARVYANAIRYSLGYVPEAWEWYANLPDQQMLNMGIFGGNDLTTIAQYSRSAIDLALNRNNQQAWHSFKHTKLVNLLVEQYSATAHILFQTTLGQEKRFECLTSSNSSLYDPVEIRKLGYTHLLASAKHNPENRIQLNHRLEQISPNLNRTCQVLAQQQVINKFIQIP